MTRRTTAISLSMLMAAGCLIAAGCEENRAPAAAHVAEAPVEDKAPAADPLPIMDAVPITDAAPTTDAALEQPVTSTDAESAPPAKETIAAPAKPAVPAGLQDITFDTIKFPLEKSEPYERSKLTPAIEALNGHNVRLRGYILPSFQQSGITQFVLVRDNMQCCFGPGAALYDCVVVDMKPGKTTDFTVRPVAVEGTFELRDFKGPDGKYLAIYHLDGEAVRF